MALPRVQTDSRDLQFVQDNVDKALTPLQSAPLNAGLMISSITLTTGQDNIVYHQLGAVPRYFIVTALNANATVWSSAQSKTSITMQTSANCVISLWIGA